uniref:Uncharacterized protein n=1 Tax=Zea mays TaxID=4577 RepID=A0A804QSG8_MAIZE
MGGCTLCCVATESLPEVERKGSYLSAGVYHCAVPLFIMYMFGLFVSPGISLWRLLQQDYGDTARNNSMANLKPTLIVLYSLAAPGRAILLQGHMFFGGATTGEASGPSVCAGCGRRGTWIHFRLSARDQGGMREGPIICQGQEPHHVRYGPDADRHGSVGISIIWRCCGKESGQVYPGQGAGVCGR